MSAKKKAASVIVIILMAVLNYLIFIGYSEPASEKTVDVQVTLTSDTVQTTQMFYLVSETDFSEEQSATAAYEEANAEQTLVFSVPADVSVIRFDLGEAASMTEIQDISFVYGDGAISLSSDLLLDPSEMNGITGFSYENALLVEAADGDPYLAWDVSGCGIAQMVEEQDQFGVIVKKVIFCVGVDFVFILALVFSGMLWSLLKELIENRRLIFRLSRNDFKTRFAGSYLGIFWAFVQPVVTVVLYWFVFEKGLKAGGINTRAGITVPFVLWLIAGLVPWFFFQDSLSGGANALIEYNYLVKKVVFKISILPIIKIISAIFVHVFFIAFMIVMFVIMGFGVSLSYVQILYYSFCVFALSLGLSFLTSSIAVFFRDLTQVIGIVLQVGTWLTPIMWNFDGIGLPSALRIVFQLNPMFYVVEGYRSALIEHTWFWQTPVMTCYFWGLVVVIFVVGTVIFRRLQVHFADVL